MFFVVVDDDLDRVHLDEDDDEERAMLDKRRTYSIK